MSDPAADADRWMADQMIAAEEEMAAIAHAAELTLSGPVQAYKAAIVALWRTDGLHVMADQYVSKSRQAESARVAITGAIHDMLIEAGLPEELCDQIEETTKALIGSTWAKKLIAAQQMPAAVVAPVALSPISIEDARPF